MAEAPSVKVFENITPVNAGDGAEVFAYDVLRDAVTNYEQSHPPRATAAWESEPDSLEETRATRQLAMEYLLRTALKAVESPDNPKGELWASRFTQASIELYGQPDAKHAAGLIIEERDKMQQLVGDGRVSQQHVNFLLDTYGGLLEASKTKAGENAGNASMEHERQAIQAYGAAIREQYQPLFDLVDEMPEEKLGPEALRQLFEKALVWLAENDDPEWSSWEAVMKNGTAMSASSEDKQIRVGSKRVPANHGTARRLLAHELLVHALRGKNAHKTGDDLLVKGLPGFLDAEEGLGLLSEEAIEGEQDGKGRNRYIDIALALGVIDGQQKSRHELFEIALARKIITSQLEGGEQKPLAKLEQEVWGSVDRIYRGGKGDSSMQNQAIYTKDLAYYNGYKKMAEYVTAQLEAGKSASEVFAYLSRGSFDPTNPKHLERLSQD